MATTPPNGPSVPPGTRPEPPTPSVRRRVALLLGLTLVLLSLFVIFRNPSVASVAIGVVLVLLGGAAIRWGLGKSP